MHDAAYIRKSFVVAVASALVFLAGAPGRADVYPTAPGPPPCFEPAFLTEDATLRSEATPDGRFVADLFRGRQILLCDEEAAPEGWALVITVGGRQPGWLPADAVAGGFITPLPGPTGSTTAPPPPERPYAGWCEHYVACADVPWEDDSGERVALAAGERLAHCGNLWLRQATGAAGHPAVPPGETLHRESRRPYPAEIPWGGIACRSMAWTTSLIAPYTPPADTDGVPPPSLQPGETVSVLRIRDGWLWCRHVDHGNLWIPADRVFPPSRLDLEAAELRPGAGCPAEHRPGEVHRPEVWLHGFDGAPLLPVNAGTRLPITCRPGSDEQGAPSCEPVVSSRDGVSWFETEYLGVSGRIRTDAVAVSYRRSTGDAPTFELPKPGPADVGFCPHDEPPVTARDLRDRSVEDPQHRVSLEMGGTAAPTQGEFSFVTLRGGVVLASGRFYPAVHAQVSGGEDLVGGGLAFGVFWEPAPLALTHHYVIAVGASAGYDALVSDGGGARHVLHQFTQQLEVRLGWKTAGSIQGVALSGGIAEVLDGDVAVRPVVGLRLLFEVPF